MTRAMIVVHRWLGVALCVIFLIWFPSGIGMMYWGYPTVTHGDQLERSPALDPASVAISPAEAYATLGYDGPPGPTRLNSFDGRPVYRFSGVDVVYADTGERQGEVSKEATARIASAWTGQPSADAIVTAVEEVDQWTLQTSLATLWPVWKYSWPNGEQVYVSQAIGEVVQYTTRASRIGAYLGPIPHWLYFTPIRRHGLEWSRLVIWSSGIGTVAAILGVIVGLSRYSPRKLYRRDGRPTSIPYHGQKRLHTLLGLVFGVATVTWAFSGMLSMDPFPSGTGGRPDARSDRGAAIRQALRGDADIAAFAAKHPRVALEALGGSRVKELELIAFDGEPVYLARLDGGGTRLIPVDGPPVAAFDRERIAGVITRAAGPAAVADIRMIDQYDRYYLDRRRERPLPVLLARLNDRNESRYYVDPATATVVGSYDARGWANRWLYHGLHSLDFPWLYNYRPLWDIVVITFMVGGTALCVTSLILAWRVIGRKLARLAAPRAASIGP